MSGFIGPLYRTSDYAAGGAGLLQANSRRQIGIKHQEICRQRHDVANGKRGSAPGKGKDRNNCQHQQRQNHRNGQTP
nr:hypothetical protein [Polymorphobacter sp.]